MEGKMIRLKVNKIEDIGVVSVQVLIKDVLRSQELGVNLYDHCNLFVDVELIDDANNTDYIISKNGLWITMFNKENVEVIYEYE